MGRHEFLQRLALHLGMFGGLGMRRQRVVLRRGDAIGLGRSRELHEGQTLWPRLYP